MGDVHHHAERLRLRVGQHLADIQHARMRDLRLLQASGPFGARASGEDLFQQGQQRVLVAGALQVGGVARIVLELRHFQRIAQPLPHRVVAAGHGHPAVAGAEGLVGHRDARAERLVFGLSRREMRGREVAQHRNARLEQRGVHLGAGAGAMPLLHGREDRERRVEPGEHVHHGRHHLLRPAIGLGIQAHHAGGRLGDEVVRARARERAVLTEPGNAAVDQPRVQPLHRLVAEPQPGHHAGAEVLDQHVGAGDEFARDAAVGLVVQVERDAALAAVEGQVHGARSFPQRGERVLARVVAAVLALHLDDIGPQVGEVLRADRSGDDAAEIQHAQPVEGGGRGRVGEGCHGSRVRASWRRASPRWSMRSRCRCGRRSQPAGAAGRARGARPRSRCFPAAPGASAGGCAC
jgi:hypothetical protein